MAPNVFATGDGRLLAGDTARFRNGLFEGKFVRPGDICLAESVDVIGMSAIGRRAVWAGERFRRPISYVSRRHETGLSILLALECGRMTERLSRAQWMDEKRLTYLQTAPAPG